MTDLSASNVKFTSRLLEAYGLLIELTDEQNEVTVYRIVSEFQIDTGTYAVLQKDNGIPEDEVEILKIIDAADGQPELVTIDDDDEWEDVAELYDELTLPFED
ncbi:DUF1292 domain-containing protein [Paenibacillus sp. PsM32]|uniref:DUF1292 domain-containing protein n=2 Tax=Paenibacillus TaxID=44249 RepID=A0ABW4UNX1_9BACL|nr:MULTISPECIES: DUF1292 domain-containing protein [Paenibacillus]MDN4618784.1 DUF1292 domain-containing protein [Paenibacillus sp. PsM32]MDQ1235312.1 uncharacterized protein YrzB (UPF0473 family) [Paenibacillus sp. SORGH_AS_0306]MDR6112361.1 uncharacterized protein YrzB (UPF0473 family) [Paenibacillus sp. SORGH_AS_0338]WCT54855.1 DUF1292 domain-containing protein [Paenibacillus kyungheensis]WDF52003.1 DUF1292 domain-containing protein [Paenibacillus sp. KACC 21273]